MNKKYSWIIASTASSLFVVALWLFGAAGMVRAAQGPLSADIQLPWINFNISDKAGVETVPAIAANDRRGSFLVVWQTGNNVAPYGVNGKLVTALGDVLAEIPLAANSQMPTYPDVAFHKYLSNEYLVVWDTSADMDKGDIYARLVYTNGVKVGSDILLSRSGDDYALHYESHPAVAFGGDADHNGLYLVVWSERWTPKYMFGEKGAEIWGAMVRSDGAVYIPPFFIGEFDDVDDYSIAYPAVAYNSVDREFLVVWDCESCSQVMGQRVEISGTLAGLPFAVGAYSMDNTEGYAYPAVAYDNINNQYLVTWHDNNGNLSSPNHDILGAIVSAQGGVVSSLVVSAADSDQMFPTLAFNERARSFLAAWYDARDPANFDLYGQWVLGGANPRLIGQNFNLTNSPGNLNQYTPALAYNALLGQFLLAWQDSRSNTDIYGMRMHGLPQDLFIHAAGIWSRPFVIRQGDAVTLFAQVFNRFGQPLTGVDVAFYNGDPQAGGTLIGVQSVNFNILQLMATVSIPWDISGLSGEQTIYVIVDPQDEVAELLETNNTAWVKRIIRPVVIDTTPPTGTLVINGGDIQTENAQVTLTIDARDNNPAGVKWMYIREWWPAAENMFSDEAIISSQRSFWQSQDSGWMRYQPEYAVAGFPYVLNSTPGIHYVQVRLRDAAGNISVAPTPIRDAINLLPASPWNLDFNAWNLYRRGWTPGTPVAVTVTVSSGDVDLFIWAPGDTGAPDLYSITAGPAAHTEVLNFIAQAGVYQIFVLGRALEGGEYMIEWQPTTALQDMLKPNTVSAGELPSEPYLPADEDPPVDSGLPEFMETGNTFYTSGWVNIAPGETITLVHNIGGDPDFYTLELLGMDLDAGGLGINHRGYGGDDDKGQRSGIYWWNLTDTSVKVTRMPNDLYADQVRVRIWVPDPAEYDSGWIGLNTNTTIALTHNLGGNVDDYGVGIKFRDDAAGGLGINHYAFGGMETAGIVEGADWRSLTSSTIEVRRFAGDTTADRARVMITITDPPIYDSGWVAISKGTPLTLTHNLGGIPGQYRVVVSTRSVIYGINTIAAGGKEVGGIYRGAFWQKLTAKTIQLYRQVNDIFAEQMRVRIWVDADMLFLPVIIK